MQSQGASHPPHSQDGQSQYCMTSKTSVHRQRGMYLSLAVKLGRRWEIAFMVEEKVGIFKKFLLIALSVSFNQFSTKETTFCQKAGNFAYFFTPILPKNISHPDWLI